MSEYEIIMILMQIDILYTYYTHFETIYEHFCLTISF